MCFPTPFDVSELNQEKYILELSKHTDLDQFYIEIYIFRCIAFNIRAFSTSDMLVFPL